MTHFEPEEQADVSVGRRRFVVGTIYSLMSMIAGALGITSGLYLFASPKASKRSEWGDAGEHSELPAGIPREVRFQRSRVDGWRIVNQQDSAWLVKDANGSLTAFSPLCTHLGCAYQWAPSRGVFSCPCHGSSFSVTGQVITGPAARPLDRYEVKRVGASVWLGPVLKSRNS